MTEFGDDMRAVGVELLAELGRDVTLTNETRSYDRTTGKTTVTGTASQTVLASPLLPYKKTVADGDLIRNDASSTFFSAVGLTLVPVFGTMILIDGETWRVLVANRFDSDANAALWEAVMVR